MRNKLSLTLPFLLTALILSPFSKAGVEDYYMASAYSIKDSVSDFNAFYSDLIHKALDDLNSRYKKPKTCQSVIKKLVPKFGGLFKSKSIPLGVLKMNSSIDYFPNVTTPKFKEHIDEKGLYFGVEKPEDLKRIFNIGGVYVGTDKFAHFFELGHWYYKRYLKTLKKESKRMSRILADKEAKKDLVNFGLKLEGTLTGKWSKMLSYGDMEANYQGFLFYHSLCHGKNPRLQKVKGEWNLVRELDFENMITPPFDDSYSLGEYNKKKWKKVRPHLIKLCHILDSSHYLEKRSSYKYSFQESFNSLRIQSLIKEGKAPSIKKYSLETVCTTEQSYQKGGLNSDLAIILPGKIQKKIDLKKKVIQIDRKTLNPENIEVNKTGDKISWTGGVLPVHRFFSINKEGQWTDPKRPPFTFEKISFKKRAFNFPIVASSTFAKGTYLTGNPQDEVVVTSIMSMNQKRGAFYFYKKTSKKDSKGRIIFKFFKKLENRDFGIPGRHGLLKHQRLSPDGKWMTFYARGTKRGSGLYLYNFQTKKTFWLSNKNDKHPTYTSKGDKILFHWQLGGNSTEPSGYNFELSYLGYYSLEFFGNNNNQVKWKRVLIDSYKKGHYHYQKHPTLYPGTNLLISHGRIHPYKGGMKLYIQDLRNPSKKWVLKLSSLEKGKEIKLTRSKHASTSFNDLGLYFVGRNKKKKRNSLYFLNPESIKQILFQMASTYPSGQSFEI